MLEKTALCSLHCTQLLYVKARILGGYTMAQPTYIRLSMPAGAEAVEPLQKSTARIRLVNLALHLRHELS